MKLDFQHQQSAHCENGVVVNLLKYNGLDQFNEPLVFGIGSGLFFVYLPFLKVNFAPGFSYRPMPGDIFKSFAKRLGIKVKHEKFSSKEKASERLNQLLEQKIPVGLQVGVFNLPYFPEAYRFHFNAHNLVVFGHEGNTYQVSDPVMETLTTLTSDELEEVRFAQGALAPKGHLYYITEVPNSYDLQKATKKAILKTCQNMLAPVPLIGTKAMKWVSRSIRKWPKKIGTKKTNHYLGQIVRMQEEIGTGGAGFRFLYGAFLQQAASILNIPELTKFAAEMNEIGDLWRDFALNIARLYKNRNNQEDVYNLLADQLLNIANREEMFFKNLRKLVKS